MATPANSLASFPHWSDPQPRRALDHIPGEDGLPVIGNTLKLLTDPAGFAERMRRQYGNIWRNRSFGQRGIFMLGAEANELVLFDRDRTFSSEQGWGPMLDLLFPRGLMLMDFDQHRIDRRALSVAFKPEPMHHYAGTLGRGIGRRLDQWGEGPLQFYPAFKQLSLDLAAESFLGVPLGDEADAINRAFIAMIKGAIGLVRRPVPFTAMGRGAAGRRFLVDWFARETQRRRAEGGGQDMFSQLAQARLDDGNPLPVDRVVDHMVFLMMAAHDTITSSASALVWLLAEHPDWQQRLRDEVLAVTCGNVAALGHEDLARLELVEMAFKEALRLVPPVHTVPRRALRDFVFEGVRVPAGTQVAIFPAAVHRDPAHWPDPDRFDPLRFRPEAVAARHKYAWVPFGGGAHMCLGLHFAHMQTKLLVANLLSRYAITLSPGARPRWSTFPIPRPHDGLRVELRRI